MRTILISPYSRELPNKARNPKNFPYWEEVVKALHELGCHIIQIGSSGQEEPPIGADQVFNDLPFESLERLVNTVDTWIAVDNFFPHFCSLINKPGIVIFAQSDPKIFGYDLHINLLKNKKYLRNNQFATWMEAEYIEKAFVSADVVTQTVRNTLGV